MGNGRKINQDLVQTETQIFLGDTSFLEEEKPKVYSLDDEFHKTKKTVIGNFFLFFFFLL